MTHNQHRGALVVALIAVLLATAGATTPVPYQTRVVGAVDTCDSRSTSRTYHGMIACVDDLAAPNPAVRHEADLWNVFLDCLSAWYRSPDNMYPGGSDVNNCLEDHGYDVGP